MTQSDPAVASDRLSRATTRRRDLAQAMAGLETVAARPMATQDWLDQVEAGLRDLRLALDAHIAEVEAPEGLLGEIVAIEPRLSPRVDELRGEHMVLLGAWLRAVAAVRAARNEGSADFGSVRRKVITLIGRLTLHRQAGSDLVFEAYNVDIAASD